MTPAPYHPEQSHWCCGCGNYELSVFDETAPQTLRIKCKRCDDWMRLGTHEHDERLEPADDTIAALQQKFSELRAMRNGAGLGRDVAHLPSATSEGQLQAAACSLMLYEDLKAAGR